MISITFKVVVSLKKSGAANIYILHIKFYLKKDDTYFTFILGLFSLPVCRIKVINRLILTLFVLAVTIVVC